MSNTRVFFTALFVLSIAAVVVAQTPSASPTPADKRGLGTQSSGQTTTTTSDQQAREAKPELVLQTGYNNFYGAIRQVFSPDGRLLATATFRSNTVKLWETATNRKLRELSNSGQTVSVMAPAVAFSRDSRLVATSGGDNSVTVWDVMSGRETQKLTGGVQGSVMASIGAYFIAFASDNRIVTGSDAIRIWNAATGQELRKLETGMPSASAFTGTDGGMLLSPDGTQLLVGSESSDSEIRVIDLATAREV